MIILSSVVICIVITLASSYAYYQSIELQNPYDTKVGEFNSGDIIFAVTIDGESSSTFPVKEAGYIVESVTCDKGATGKWDNGLWDIRVSGLTQSQTICNIEFITGIWTLANEIKQQGGGVSAIEAKGDPAFNVAPTAATSGIYATDDEYGTSYYYRGDKSSLKNNLIFAGFQWKIVRVNGDGSVRIIYNGTEAQFNTNKEVNTTGTNTQIGTWSFNGNTNNNSYLNYTNSSIKTYIDNWYANNIITKGISVMEKITDNLFCNDRQLGRDYPGAPQDGDGWNGTGVGTSRTYYAAYFRIGINSSNPKPTLKCAQKNDRFTVIDVSVGNGVLTYPIGLITADELSYSGIVGVRVIANQYMSTLESFWTLTPSLYSPSIANMLLLTSNSSTEETLQHGMDVRHSYGVRPVLNLNANTIVTGSGSATDPFKVI